MSATARSHSHQPPRRRFTGALLAAAALLLCGGLIFLLTRSGSRQPSAPTSPKTDTSPSAGVENTVIHLAAAGDVNVTDNTVAAGQNGGSYDYTDVFLDAVPLLADADLTVVNFEGTLCGAPYGTETTSAPAEMMTALRNAGVDLVQTANSCSIAGGLVGLAETLDGVRSAGLEPVGTFRDSAEFKKTGGYTIREVRGIRIAFVAFTKGMNNRGLPAGSEDCVNLLYEDYASTYQSVDTAAITRVLQAVQSENPDLTVALLHWGSEYNDQISSTQESIRNLMISEGVDVILGTHSHYVQEIDYDETDHTLVAYSLGDFLGDAQRAGSNYSLILNLEITKNGETGETYVSGYRYDPIFIRTSGSLRVLRMDAAIAAYEADNIDRVTKDEYDTMVYAKTRIEERIHPAADTADSGDS